VIGDERDVTRWTRRRVHWSLFRRRWCETKWSSKNFCQIPKSSPISLPQLPTRFGTCSPRTGDGWSAQATCTRLHLAVTVTYKYNIVHTSTRLITRYAAFLAAGLQPKKKQNMDELRPIIENGNAWTRATQTVASTSSLLCGCKGRTF